MTKTREMKRNFTRFSMERIYKLKHVTQRTKGYSTIKTVFKFPFFVENIYFSITELALAISA